MLTSSQVDQYHRDGYVIPDYRVKENTIEAIRSDHSRFVERYPEFEDYCPALLVYDMTFLNYARDNEILDMVAQLIGPNIALWNSSFFAKPPTIGSRTPWHQDGEYWPHVRYGLQLTNPPWRTDVCRLFLGPTENDAWQNTTPIRLVDCLSLWNSIVINSMRARLWT